MRRHRSVALFLVFALVAYHVFAILVFAPARIDGRWYVLADDDVMISLRYARNLAEGNGLVLNVGERVEGFTNPLLTLLGAALHLAHAAPPFLPLLLDLINVAFSICILWMLVRFWGETSRGKLAGLFAGALYVLGPQHIFYAHAGFEVYLQAAILLYCVWRIERLGWSWAFLLGLLPLTHGTSQVAWGVLCAALLLLHRGRWSLRLAWLALAVAPAAAYQIFRLAYYGEALPNTYWLKVGSGSLSGGLAYVRGWVVAVLPMVVLGAYPALRAGRAALERVVSSLSLARARLAATDVGSDRAIAAVTVLVAHVAAVVALGGDYFPQSRFLFPCSVLLAVMAGQGGALLLEAVEHGNGRRGPVLRAFAITVALSALAAPCVNALRVKDDLADIRRWNIQHVAMGLALKANTPPDAVVALVGLGAVSYYSERPCIDMLGKADPHIARTKPHAHRRLAHNKSDFDYVLRRSPDFIEMRRRPEELADIPLLTERSLTSPHGHADELALHPLFRARYLPTPVKEKNGRLLPFYARSPAGATGWTAPEECSSATDAP